MQSPNQPNKPPTYSEGAQPISDTSSASLSDSSPRAVAVQPAPVRPPVPSCSATQQKRAWNTWMNHEQQLFTHLENLEEHMQTPLPDWIKQQVLLELQTIAQHTTDRFNQIAIQILDPIGQSSSQPALTQPIAVLEQQLWNLRNESRNYPLSPLISFCATFTTLKAIAHNLDQITQTNTQTN